jgi:hypothetical protein
LFLLNHDAEHQVAHVAGLVACTAQDGGVEIIVACGTEGIFNTAVAMVGEKAAERILWRRLDLPPLAELLLAPLNKLAPVKRLARLNRHLALFASVDVIVSPERTCLDIKRKLGCRAPKFVFVPHGAGDRSVTYHPAMADFDLMLVSGQKVVDEMVAHGIVSSNDCRIIGYPKFDTIDAGRRDKFFDNDNPVFLYNPHFDPYLSSWYDQGISLLEFFYNNKDRYNLIFAPHVMLFRKKFHYSLEYRSARIRPEIPEKFFCVPNIRLDVSSHRLFDMSYTLASDVYIGDVSSQVYEFLLRGGACYFIDSHTSRKPGAGYHFWKAGEVFATVEEMTERIGQWRSDAANFALEQRHLFAYTMDIRPGMSASQRGAAVLVEYAREVAGA